MDRFGVELADFAYADCATDAAAVMISLAELVVCQH